MRTRFLGSIGLASLLLSAGCGEQPSERPTAGSPIPPKPASAPMPRSLRAAAIAAKQADAGDAYRYNVEGSAIAANNPSHGLSVTMSTSNVRVKTSGEDEAVFSFAGVSCDGDIEPPSKVEPGAMGNRVEYRRNGVTEWYVNGPLGVEQGFDVSRKPLQCHKPLTYEIAVSGGLVPTLAEDGNSVDLVDSTGSSRLRYSELFAFDANGKELVSSLAVHDGRIAIRVDDTTATYPIRIDPLIAIPRAKLLAGDGSSADYFGCAVAIDGNVAIVGAYGDNLAAGTDAGSAYMFTKVGNFWDPQTKLMPPVGGPTDNFGISVAVSGTTAVVGAWLDDNAAGTDAGSAYVYVFNGTSWQLQQQLFASNGAASDQFGTSLAASGDTIIVGAPAHAGGGTTYVFVRNGTTWTEQAQLVPSDAATGMGAGSAVALDGDSAIVAARGSGVGGAAYVFVRNAGAWTQQQKLTAADTASMDAFGYSVDIDANTAIIGAPYHTTPAGSAAGASYVFARNGSTWSQQQKLTASNGSTWFFFGNSVAVSGNYAVVGSWDADLPTTNTGAAYIFTRSGSTWSQLSMIQATDTVSGDFFGRSVGVSGNLVLIGAYYDDIGSVSNQGSAHVFEIFDQLQNGATCSTPLECISGFCSDGVCCDASCGGSNNADCQACSMANGATANGVCTILSNTTVCRAAVDLCDSAELCDGVSSACPVNTLKPAGSVCRAAAGTCDVAEVCSGNSTTCPADTLVAVGTTCRAAADTCDVAETCSGTNAACPADAFKSAGTTCRAAAGTCDVAEVCPGNDAACPTDAFKTAGTTCRTAAGTCDVAEVCPGNSGACPADILKSAGTTCRGSGGPCDLVEVCDGLVAACPANALKPAGSECRASAGPCDIAEACDGASTACPANGFVAAGAQCRAAADICDVAEVCPGNADACPTDVFAAAGTMCRASQSACDAAETCTGMVATCPVNSPAAATVVCRAALGPCDITEMCDGVAFDCPIDQVANVMTVCRPLAGPCDIAEKCDGVSKGCTPDVIATTTVTCRPAANDCDAAEMCSGVNTECPMDMAAADGTMCDNGVCAAGECIGGGTGGNGGMAGAGGATGGNGGMAGAGGETGGNGGMAGAGGETGGNGGMAGAGGETGGVGGATSGGDPVSDGGCNCHVVGGASTTNRSTLIALLAMGLTAMTSRRRRRSM